MSCEYDTQSEKLAASSRNSSLSSSCPLADFHAPRTVTGSFLDQTASRGAASPLCRASSASLRRDLAHPRNSSLSSMSTPPGLGGFYIAHAVSRHESLLPMRKRYGKIAMVEDFTDRRQAL